MKRQIYLDHSATTYVKNEVLDEMLPYFNKEYGNASSSYYFGQTAKKAIEEARKKVAEYINCKTEEIYFTSGGSEADNLALFGIARANKHKGNHIITSKIEHHAVLNACKALEKDGFKVTYLDVDKDGKVSVDTLRKAITQDTILVSIMFANNEIGTIQDIEEIGKLCRFKGIIFHTDAVQAVGNIQIDVEKMNIDSLSMSAHKFYGPKGVGALYVKKNIGFNPIIYGGHQEKDKRAGTENTPGIVGMGKAIELARTNLEKNNKYLQNLRDKTIQRLINEIPDIKINGSMENRLPGNVNFSIKNIDGRTLLLMLEMEGLLLSSGSACTSNKTTPSHVLEAIGQEKEYLTCTLRITFGEQNIIDDIDYVLDKLKECIIKIKQVNST